MKLWKEKPGVWAGRTALDAVTDIDVEVRRLFCGKTHTIINLCASYDRNGLLMDHGHDGVLACVYGWKSNITGSARIEYGHADIYSWTDFPFSLQLSPLTKRIPLEYVEE